MYASVLSLYAPDCSNMLHEFPFRVAFDGERAIDTGGVTRDMFSAFWEQAYRHAFDGGSTLIPATHPQMDQSVFPTLGTILSHGYVTCGFIPIRVAFPTLARCLLGSSALIPEAILLDSFADYLSPYDAKVVREAIKLVVQGGQQVFSPPVRQRLITILSGFDCTNVPTPANLKQILLQVARNQFLRKPMAASAEVHSGIPECHRSIWTKKTVRSLMALYKALSANVESVIQQIEEPEFLNRNEGKVFGYLLQYIGSMKAEELSLFLRFVTGSSVCSAQRISITFNSLSGLARRPISHTCSNTLELSTTYSTFPEFVAEFQAILTDPIVTWYMDGI